MQVHDWTRVDASTFHDFHTGWIVHLKESLNAGVLPSGYYAQAEQHIGRKIGDVLALHASDPERVPLAPQPPEGGAVAVAEAPPRVSRTHVLSPSAKRRRRTLTVRHSSGHRIIALVEILSPANKSSDGVGEFVRKAEGAIRAGIHLLLVDLLPPGRHDPQGIHEILVEALEAQDDDQESPQGKPLTFASYAAGPTPVAYLEPVAVGDPVPDMPLFLTPERYVSLPLSSTYAAAYRGVPAVWRDVIEGRAASGG